MYERSAIILERNINELLNLDKSVNVKLLIDSYIRIVEDTKQYQNILAKEQDIIEKFDEIANQVQKYQSEQEQIYTTNKKLEETRYNLFHDFEIAPNELDAKVSQIEEQLDNNNVVLKELRKQYNDSLAIFNQRQAQRKEITATKKQVEKKHFDLIQDCLRLYKMISQDDINALKKFQTDSLDNIKILILDEMIENGKSERVPFDTKVIDSAIDFRLELAKNEAQIYSIAYERFKKLLSEIEKDDIQLAKYEKSVKDIQSKTVLINCMKDYLASYLDNERMVAFNGNEVHMKLMNSAYLFFQNDTEQFKNLYSLLCKETNAKATKELYKELYNYQYLVDVSNEEYIYNNSSATYVNPSFWRIENVKNVFRVFRAEVVDNYKRNIEEFEQGITPTKISNINGYETEQNEVNINKTDVSNIDVYIYDKNPKSENWQVSDYDNEENTRYLNPIEDEELKKKSKQNIQDNLKDIIDIKSNKKQDKRSDTDNIYQRLDSTIIAQDIKTEVSKFDDLELIQRARARSAKRFEEDKAKQEYLQEIEYKKQKEKEELDRLLKQKEQEKQAALDKITQEKNAEFEKIRAENEKQIEEAKKHLEELTKQKEQEKEQALEIIRAENEKQINEVKRQLEEATKQKEQDHLIEQQLLKEQLYVEQQQRLETQRQLEEQRAIIQKQLEESELKSQTLKKFEEMQKVLEQKQKEIEQQQKTFLEQRQQEIAEYEKQRVLDQQYKKEQEEIIEQLKQMAQKNKEDEKKRQEELKQKEQEFAKKLQEQKYINEQLEARRQEDLMKKEYELQQVKDEQSKQKEKLKEQTAKELKQKEEELQKQIEKQRLDNEILFAKRQEEYELKELEYKKQLEQTKEQNKQIEQKRQEEYKQKEQELKQKEEELFEQLNKEKEQNKQIEQKRQEEYKQKEQELKQKEEELFEQLNKEKEQNKQIEQKRQEEYKQKEQELKQKEEELFEQLNKEKEQNEQFKTKTEEEKKDLAEKIKLENEIKYQEQLRRQRQELIDHQLEIEQKYISQIKEKEQAIAQEKEKATKLEKQKEAYKEEQEKILKEQLLKKEQQIRELEELRKKEEQRRQEEIEKLSKQNVKAPRKIKTRKPKNKTEQTLELNFENSIADFATLSNEITSVQELPKEQVEQIADIEHQADVDVKNSSVNETFDFTNIFETPIEQEKEQTQNKEIEKIEENKTSQEEKPKRKINRKKVKNNASKTTQELKNDLFDEEEDNLAHIKIDDEESNNLINVEDRVKQKNKVVKEDNIIHIDFSGDEINNIFYNEIKDENIVKTLVTDQSQETEDILEDNSSYGIFDNISYDDFDFSNQDNNTNFGQITPQKVVQSEAASSFGLVLFEDGQEEYEDSFTKKLETTKIESTKTPNNLPNQVSLDKPKQEKAKNVAKTDDFDTRLQKIREKNTVKEQQKPNGIFGKLFGK